MNELFVSSSSAKGYLREDNYCYPLDKNILLQGAFVIGTDGNSFPSGQKNLPPFVMDMKLIFMEMSFDPIARIKRGKLYKLGDGAQPAALYPSSLGGVYQVHASNPNHSMHAYKFVPYDLTREFNPRNTFIIFGNSRFETRWRVLSIDASVANEEVFVLQEVNSIGAIPSLNINTIPAKHYSEIEKEYSNLLAELNSSPESVIDHCRDVAISLLSAIVGLDKKDERIDLGKLISRVDDELRVIKNSAEIINRFHPRRKPNEREKLGLSELTRVESDFAIQCVFQIIREKGWNL